MKYAALPLLIGMIALSGCAHHYVMTLTSGAQITTSNKPQLKDGSYHFKDTKGQELSVPAFNVRELAPAAVAERESKPQAGKFKSEKKHHWYFLWLA